jgi:membrane protein DedA with SNARE-associated domain
VGGIDPIIRAKAPYAHCAAGEAARVMTWLIEQVLAELARFVIAVISKFGYMGIVVTMAIESACIPLPSEIIMPFSGYLISTGQFSMLGVTLAGAVGNVIGSIVAYYAGVWGGRPFAERYGPYVLISRRDLELADRWFMKYGEAAVLISRMLPVVRTFISLPAGIAQMNFPRFVVFTFIGAIPWCYLLAYIGFKMGERWDELREYFHGFDILIGLLLAAALAYFLWSHWPRKRAHVE